MNHNRAFTCTKLRNLALQFERGALDMEFAEAQVPITALREVVVQRIRELADAIGSDDP